MYMIKDIPKEERPRERLLKNGSSSLSNQEILSIILKSGTNGKSVSTLALDILNSINDITDLKDITISKLEEIKGIGKVKAIELMSSIELGRRIFISNNNSFDIGTKLDGFNNRV